VQKAIVGTMPVKPLVRVMGFGKYIMMNTQTVATYTVTWKKRNCQRFADCEYKVQLAVRHVATAAGVHSTRTDW
jgi:hypothetical protein